MAGPAEREEADDGEQVGVAPDTRRGRADPAAARDPGHWSWPGRSRVHHLADRGWCVPGADRAQPSGGVAAAVGEHRRLRHGDTMTAERLTGFDAARAGPGGGRTGRVRAGLAGSEWKVGGALGALVLVVVAAADGLLAEILAEHGMAGVIGGLLALVLLGGAPGVLVGVLVQVAVRVWRRSGGRLRSGSWLRSGGRLGGSVRSDDEPAKPYWADRHRRCRDAVHRFHAIAEVAPPGPGRDWLRAVAGDLDLELAEALRLARYGEAAPGDGEVLTDAAARRCSHRLDLAARSFADAARRAATIAVDLAEEPDFDRIRAQLDMLAAQSRQLRAPRPEYP